jgi:SAM-dependent methyltransferase
MGQQNPMPHEPHEEIPGSPVADPFEEIPGLELPEMPWRFAQTASTLAQLSHHVLAIGPAASRLLGRLHGTLAEEGVAVLPPDDAHAVTRDHLGALGLEVLEHDPAQLGATLPFPPERFDLVIVLDAPYDPAEAHRVLIPDGVLLAQQRGHDDLQELRGSGADGPLEDRHAADPDRAATLEDHRRLITEAGLEVESSETFHGTGTASSPRALAALRTVAGAGAARPALPATVTHSRFMVQARRPGRPEVARTDFGALLGERMDVPRV